MKTSTQWIIVISVILGVYLYNQANPKNKESEK
jgi:hypothetical protein